ncbi:AzlD domain-containing protein [Nocardioides lentus]|uniref:AzlD domain-containing protein n=1 Tax=Nocardioides lentus TaxID=338077 RepID=UPI0031DB7DA3
MSEAGVWLVIVAVAVLTALIKGAGPLVLGSRQLPPRLVGVIVLLPSALLAALVVTTALADGQAIRIGATAAGVATGGVLLLVRAPLVAAVVAAVLVTAGLRALGVA